MFNGQIGNTRHLTSIRNKFSSTIVRLIKEKYTKIKPVRNIIFLNSEEAHRMKWCTVLNQNEDMVIREQLMEFQMIFS